MNSLPICPENIKHDFIGGIDEVGYGCFAGPVVAALVILPRDFESEIIVDSKVLKSVRKRQLAYDEIIENAIDYVVEAVSVKTINKVGIVKANMMAMEKCIQKIFVKPDYLLIDGINWDGYDNVPFQTVVKGDSTYLPIAAASIIAKVRRDGYMKELSKTYPGYGWDTNMGYGTQKHIEGLKELGATDYHRIKYIRNHI